MRLAVSGNGYATATNELLEANRSAASTAHTLMSELAHSAAMAGHTAAGFAASYDHAASQGVAALVDLTDALANLGRMTDATRRNHAYAEARAVIGHRPVAVEEPAGPTYTHVTLRPPPSAAGTHGSSLPSWAAWVLDRVEGFVWPDSDIDRLRATARAWRAAASHLELVRSRCEEAAFSLSIEIAPDVALASNATRRLGAQVEALAQTFHTIASSCDQLADEVHDHRQQVLDIVHDTLRDAVIVEGVGLVLGAVTGGITAAAATSVNGARIAAIAPKLIRIIEALRLAIGASETSARLAADAVIEARTSFRAFIRARIITTASDRGCAMPFWFVEVRDDGTRVVKPTPGWLYNHENPGHVLSKHVGKTVEELVARFKKDPHIPFSSSFEDYGTAEKFTRAALDERAGDVAAWLAGARPSQVFKAELGVPTGLSVDPAGNAHVATGVRMFLVRDPAMPEGFRVHTSFPEPMTKAPRL